jgi:hypothetical protein
MYDLVGNIGDLSRTCTVLPSMVFRKHGKSKVSKDDFKQSSRNTIQTSSLTQSVMLRRTRYLVISIDIWGHYVFTWFHG